MVGQPGQGERRVRYSGGAIGTEAGQMLLSIVKWRRDLLRTENAITASSSWQIDA